MLKKINFKNAFWLKTSLVVGAIGVPLIVLASCGTPEKKEEEKINVNASVAPEPIAPKIDTKKEEVAHQGPLVTITQPKKTETTETQPSTEIKDADGSTEDNNVSGTTTEEQSTPSNSITEQQSSETTTEQSGSQASTSQSTSEVKAEQVEAHSGTQVQQEQVKNTETSSTQTQTQTQTQSQPSTQQHNQATGRNTSSATTSEHS